jgi:hypothetical protein
LEWRIAGKLACKKNFAEPIFAVQGDESPRIDWLRSGRTAEEKPWHDALTCPKE